MQPSRLAHHAVHVLIIDDRVDARRSAASSLRRDGHAVHEADGFRDGLAMLRTHPCQFAVVSLRPERDPDVEDAIGQIKIEAPGTDVVIVGSGGVADAVRAMKAAAVDYLQSPLDPLELARRIRDHLRSAERMPGGAGRHAAQHPHAQEMVVADPRMHHLLARAEQAAAVDCTVLVTGESGTGKEVICRRMVQASRRRGGRFVTVNCGAIPDTLVESELFGHKRGAFTGAMGEKMGLVEEADGGVLLLDEIGEMPARAQVALLRFLDSGELRRVGDTATRHVNVRIIAATNRELEHEVRAGRFRLDLFHRLSVVSLHVPPLRERPDDVPVLAEHFLRRAATSYGKPVHGFSPVASTLLARWTWPGNARELQNVVEGAVVFASGPTISAADLPSRIHGERQLPPAEPERTLADLAAALEQYDGNHTHAAAALGISRTTLWRHLRKMRGHGARTALEPLERGIPKVTEF